VTSQRTIIARLIIGVAVALIVSACGSSAGQNASGAGIRSTPATSPGSPPLAVFTAAPQGPPVNVKLRSFQNGGDTLVDNEYTFAVLGFAQTRSVVEDGKTISAPTTGTLDIIRYNLVLDQSPASGSNWCSPQVALSVPGFAPPTSPPESTASGTAQTPNGMTGVSYAGSGPGATSSSCPNGEQAGTATLVVAVPRDGGTWLGLSSTYPSPANTSSPSGVSTWQMLDLATGMRSGGDPAIFYRNGVNRSIDQTSGQPLVTANTNPSSLAYSVTSSEAFVGQYASFGVTVQVTRASLSWSLDSGLITIPSGSGYFAPATTGPDSSVTPQTPGDAFLVVDLSETYQGNSSYSGGTPNPSNPSLTIGSAAPVPSSTQYAMAAGAFNSGSNLAELVWQVPSTFTSGTITFPQGACPTASYGCASTSPFNPSSIQVTVG